MKCNNYVCDVCGKHVPRYDHIVRLKARSGKFVTYENMEDFFADRKTVDICIDCIECFKVFARNRRCKDGKAD